MSDSHAPVATSRMKDAPVAAPTARAQRASHRKSTPNGTPSGLHSVTTRVIAAADSSPAWSWYGRSFSLQKRTASNPAPSSASTSRRTHPIAPGRPASASYSGVPGNAGTCAIAISGLPSGKVVRKRDTLGHS